MSDLKRRKKARTQQSRWQNAETLFAETLVYGRDRSFELFLRLPKAVRVAIASFESKHLDSFQVRVNERVKSGRSILTYRVIAVRRFYQDSSPKPYRQDAVPVGVYVKYR